ncbi:hypothetical protein Goari_024439 [Gossypium aridum]|uniref:Uncharacterized protein n=1 Tax=Gossypium aridum TaxID=34290 RepID=A0A7J8X629_GOSAI|nr:hypothetical protein [Gossypium aridum]
MVAPPLDFIFGPLSLEYYMPMPLMFQKMTNPTMMYRPPMFGALIESPIVLPLVYGTQYNYTPMPVVSQTHPGSLFYQGRTSLQPRVPRIEDTQYQSRSNQPITINYIQR